MVKERGSKASHRAKYGILVLSLLLLSLPVALGKTLIDRVVANVNGEPILESELKLASLFYGVKDREKLVRMLVDKYLIVQHLKSKGFNLPSTYSDEYLKELAKSNGKSLEEFLKEMYSEGITPQDLKRFVELETLSTYGLRNFLSRKVDVSQIEIEIERLKKGEVKFAKRIELLVLDKDKAQELLKLDRLEDLEYVAKSLGGQIERLKVYKGDLVEPLDKEVWKADVGKVVVAEDENNIYLAKVLKVEREYSGRSEEEIKEEIVSKKVEALAKELLEELKEKGYIDILISSKSAS